MIKIKETYVNIKNNWNEEKTAKTAKIISFFAGLFGNVLGIILVAIWKYVFANNSEKSKYCIRLAFIGWITNAVICFKFFLSDPFYFMDKKFEKVARKAPIHIEKMYIDDFFDREMEEMNKSFERQRRMFNNMFDAVFEEQEKAISKELKNDKKNQNVQVFEQNSPTTKTTKKVIKHDNGYETTIIEENGPISHTKIITEHYVGNGNKNDSKQKEMKNKKVENNKHHKNHTKDKKNR